jgi:hypothetical protein
MTEREEYPVVVVTHDGSRWWEFPWDWKVMGGGDGQAEFFSGLQGCASFRLGAIFAAKKAIRRQRRREKGKSRPEERISLGRRKG